ncbi:MAG: UDP-glucose 4-epimerase GalE [Formosimonas sp.]
MNILLTGGTGYIGAHTAVSLMDQGHTPILLDNFVNSSPRVIERIEHITGIRPALIELDVLSTTALARTLRDHQIDAVIHFAALKAVGESVVKPIDYYHNNVMGFLSVLQAMREACVFRIVLSSSATVYGENAPLPYLETHPALSANSPYGQSKVMMERIMQDTAASDPRWQHATLRYFNPVGAHPSGLIGEHPSGIPNNLVPYIQQVAIGLRDKLSVFGNDYDTLDGTGARDYIHVMDLARGHGLALQWLFEHQGSLTVNLGTGQPLTVLQLVAAFEQASKKAIPYQIVPRRAGDIASMYADVTLAQDLLGFRTQYDVHAMCQDAWHWQNQNPNGYESNS